MFWKTKKAASAAAKNVAGEVAAPEKTKHDPGAKLAVGKAASEAASASAKNVAGEIAAAEKTKHESGAKLAVDKASANEVASKQSNEAKRQLEHEPVQRIYPELSNDELKAELTRVLRQERELEHRIDSFFKLKLTRHAEIVDKFDGLRQMRLKTEVFINWKHELQLSGVNTVALQLLYKERHEEAMKRKKDRLESEAELLRLEATEKERLEEAETDLLAREIMKLRREAELARQKEEDMNHEVNSLRSQAEAALLQQLAIREEEERRLKELQEVERLKRERLEALIEARTSKLRWNKGSAPGSPTSIGTGISPRSRFRDADAGSDSSASLEGRSREQLDDEARYRRDKMRTEKKVAKQMEYWSVFDKLKHQVAEDLRFYKNAAETEDFMLSRPETRHIFGGSPTLETFDTAETGELRSPAQVGSQSPITRGQAATVRAVETEERPWTAGEIKAIYKGAYYPGRKEIEEKVASRRKGNSGPNIDMTLLGVEDAATSPLPTRGQRDLEQRLTVSNEIMREMAELNHRQHAQYKLLEESVRQSNFHQLQRMARVKDELLQAFRQEIEPLRVQHAQQLREDIAEARRALEQRSRKREAEARLEAIEAQAIAVRLARTETRLAADHLSFKEQVLLRDTQKFFSPEERVDNSDVGSELEHLPIDNEENTFEFVPPAHPPWQDMDLVPLEALVVPSRTQTRIRNLSTPSETSWESSQSKWPLRPPWKEDLSGVVEAIRPHSARQSPRRASWIEPSERSYYSGNRGGSGLEIGYNDNDSIGFRSHSFHSRTSRSARSARSTRSARSGRNLFDHKEPLIADDSQSRLAERLDSACRAMPLEGQATLVREWESEASRRRGSGSFTSETSNTHCRDFASQSSRQSGESSVLREVPASFGFDLVEQQSPSQSGGSSIHRVASAASGRGFELQASDRSVDTSSSTGPARGSRGKLPPPTQFPAPFAPLQNRSSGRVYSSLDARILQQRSRIF